MQFQNEIPGILIVLVAIIVILLSYINFKKWLKRKQVYVAIFAVILFISFITLKAAVHYNFLKFHEDFGWSSALLAAVIFFIIISPVVLFIYETLRSLNNKSVQIKDTPLSVPLFEEKIDSLPDKRSFGILKEEIYKTSGAEIELEKPFEKITEISQMEQVISNIESGLSIVEVTPKSENFQEQNALSQTTEPVKETEDKAEFKKIQKVKAKKTVTKAQPKKTAVKKSNVKTSKSGSTAGKKNK